LRRILSSSALALGLLAMACTRFATVGTDIIGPGYTIDGGEWDSGGGITTAIRVFERDGVTVVCGAWTTDRQSVLSIRNNDDVIEAASLYAGSTRLARDLGFMSLIRYSQNISGAQANCIASGKPWQPEFAETAPRIRFPLLAFRLSSGSGQTIIFRRSTRPDIIR
jgi:hypothetical protein